MTQQKRTESGKFSAKSDENRAVRSIRLTDATWEALGAIADSRCITRADLIEQIVERGIASQQLDDTVPQESPEKSMENQECSSITLQRITEITTGILNNLEITRNGKDKASVRRALEALLKELS